MSYAKETLFQNMSKYQIACKPGHRPSEHLFVIKSVISFYQNEGQGILMNSFDLRKFYDSEHIFDCMGELYSSQLKGKLYRLIYEMNKNIRIQVKTPVGLTEPEDTGPTVGQGGVDACTISAVNVDNGVNVAFVDSDGEIVYSGLPLAPLIYMDDIFRMGNDIESAQDANRRIVNMVESKLLDLNLDKTNYLIMGSKKARKKLVTDLQKTPLTIYDQPMKEAKTLKYLGDHFSYNLEESVHLTVTKRIAVAKQAIYEIRHVLEDIRSSKVGGFNVAIDIWQMAVEPMLLYNAESWQNMPRKTLKALNDLYSHFYCCIFRIGSGSPVICFYW